MGNFFDQAWVRSFFLAVIMLGVMVGLFGAWQYIDATVQLQDNLAYQQRNSGEEPTVESDAQARVLFASDLQRRELVSQQNTGLILGGVGLVTIAVGWIALNLIRGRQETK